MPTSTSQQPALEGMPRRLTRATPARLGTWLQCPRRYRFSYLDRPTPPKRGPWAHFTVGTAAHVALAGWWRSEPERRTPELAARLVDRGWPEPTGQHPGGFRDPEQSERWRASVRTMVAAYAETLDPAAEPRGVERTVSVVYGSTALSGRVDRIDEGEDGLVVIDYKTGLRPLNVHDAKSSQALAIYAAAASSTLRTRCRRVELHHLPTGEVHAWEHDDASLLRQLDRADAVADEYAQADAAFAAGHRGDDVFPPVPSAACGWCEFAPVCPEGAQATPQRAPWAGLGPDEA